MAGKSKAPVIYVANQPFLFKGTRQVAQGQMFAADDPIVKGRESLFRVVTIGATDDGSPAVVPAEVAGGDSGAGTDGAS